MPHVNDLSRSPVTLEQDSTLIVVIEMSQNTWLVGAMLPGVERQPLKKLLPDPDALLALLARWRQESEAAGHRITRIAVAYEAGRDGFWLARWLRARGVEAHVIHPTSVAVARTHRRAKTDRLDVKLLSRAFLGWLRGEPDHCTMAALPSLAEEDARRPGREREKLVGERTRLINRMKAAFARFGLRGVKLGRRLTAEGLAALRTPEGVRLPPNSLAELGHDLERLRLVERQIKEIEAARDARLAPAPEDPATDQRAGDERALAMARQLARVRGLGPETASLLVHELLIRNLRDRRAVARYAGLTGAPDESGQRRREKGLSRAGNARVRRAMIQLAWRFLMFQKQSALAQWFQQRCEDLSGDRRPGRKRLIVALARKLLIALWRLVTSGEVPQGLVLRPAG